MRMPGVGGVEMMYRPVVVGGRAWCNPPLGASRRERVHVVVLPGVSLQDPTPPPPPCACTALSKHGVGVEPPF